MAFLSLLLSVWEVCSSGMEVPYFLVTGARLDGEASWAPVVKVLAEGFGEEVSRGWDPDAGRGWSRLGKRGGPARPPGLGCDVGSLGVQGDELSGQVLQDRPGGVGEGLLVQG